MATATEIDWNKKLLDAADGGNLAGVEEALTNGADVNAKDNDGWTALHWASRLGHIETVKALLQVDGIEINAKDNDGWTALHYASMNGRTEVVKALLQVDGLEINAENHEKNTALDFARQHNHHYFRYLY